MIEKKNHFFGPWLNAHRVLEFCVIYNQWEVQPVKTLLHTCNRNTPVYPLPNINSSPNPGLCTPINTSMGRFYLQMNSPHSGGWEVASLRPVQGSGGSGEENLKDPRGAFAKGIPRKTFTSLSVPFTFVCVPLSRPSAVVTSGSAPFCPKKHKR